MNTKNTGASNDLPQEVLADLESLISDMHEGPGEPASAEILLDLRSKVTSVGDDRAVEHSFVESTADASDDATRNAPDVNPIDDHETARAAVGSSLKKHAVSSERPPGTPSGRTALRRDLPLDALWGESGTTFGPMSEANSTRRWFAQNWAFVTAGLFIAMGVVLMLVAVIFS